MVRRHAAALGFVGAALSGCGGGQTRGHPLETEWNDADGVELAAFEVVFDDAERVRARSAAADALPSLFVGVVAGRLGAERDESDPLEDPVATILGVAEPSGTRWAFVHALGAPPVIAGSVVVGIGGGELFAIEGATGEPLWRRPAFGRMRGAGDDGAVTIVTLEALSGARATVLAVGRDGTVRRQLDVAPTAGAPAVADDIAFLPWNRREILIFDLEAGREAARVVLSDDVAEARVEGGELFFGAGTRSLAFDAKIPAARDGGGTRTALAVRALPERPAWFGGIREREGAAADRTTSVRVHARAGVGGPSRYLLTYYRLAAAFDAATGALRWVRTNAADVLGGHATATGFAICDASGRAEWFDAASGATVRTGALGAELTACSVSGPQPGPAGDASGRPLTRELGIALAVDDRRLLPLQLELLGDLDGIEGDAAADELIAVAARELTPEPLRRMAAERLARRTTGYAAMIGALAAAVRSPGPDVPPLGALARALGGADRSEAVPVLAALVNDARLSAPERRDLALALERMGGPEVRDAFMLLLATSLCSTGGRGPEADAAEAAARALVRLGARASVTRARDLAQRCEGGLAARLGGIVE